jgi:hypothetical protein
MDTPETACIPCGLRTFRRNTYFNGKLLVERDFKDEQGYLVGKDWLHNSLLHGTGTVCGLKLRAHPNEECRRRYVFIEPGLALDCCGREIVVPEPHLVDLETLLAEQEITIDADGGSDLLVSLCYAEAGAEKVPVILPECSCADRIQAFNRIKETFAVRLRAAPAGQGVPARPPAEASLDWRHTLVLPDQSPRAVAIDGQLGQLYVAAQATPADGDGGGELGARLFAYSTETHDLITAVEIGRDPIDLALSPLGDLIYVAVGSSGAELGPAIAIYTEARLRDADPGRRLIELAEPARLAVAPSGTLFALLLDSGRLLSWSQDEIRAWLDPGNPAPGPAPGNQREFELGHGFAADGPARRGARVMEVTADGRLLFIADPEASDAERRLRVIDVALLYSGPATSDPADEITVPLDLPGSPVALATSQDAEFVYLLLSDLDEADPRGRLVRYQISSAGGVFALTQEGRGGVWPGAALDLATAPDERWAYVLQTDDDRAYVQALSIDQIASLETEEPVNPTTTREAIAGAPRFERLSLVGERLYVASEDAETALQPARGLVAVLDVSEEDCARLIDRVIEACPACAANGDDHCVTIAHLPNYTPGDLVQDPDVGSQDDVHIDNLTYRPIVPSSTTIVETIRCMLEQGIGEGRPGPRGPAGAPGRDGVDGQDGADGADGVGVPPGGTAGQMLVKIDATDFNTEWVDPPLGGDPTLAHIQALSWVHGAVSFDGTDDFLQRLIDPGIVIAFDRDVQMENILSGLDPLIASEVFQLIGRTTGNGGLVEVIVPGLQCEPVEVTGTDGAGRITGIEPREGQPLAQAVRLFLPELPAPDTLIFVGREENRELPNPLTEAWATFTSFEFDGQQSQFNRVGSRGLDLRRRMSVALGEPIDAILVMLRHSASPCTVRAIDAAGNVYVRTMSDNQETLRLDGPGIVALDLEAPQNEAELQAIHRVGRAPLGASFYRVVFRADLVLDDVGRAVDGNHLGGRVSLGGQSGNGQQGGTFESWFAVGR